MHQISFFNHMFCFNQILQKCYKNITHVTKLSPLYHSFFVVTLDNDAPVIKKVYVSTVTLYVSYTVKVKILLLKKDKKGYIFTLVPDTAAIFILVIYQTNYP